jgi:hypothetical protein
MSKAGGWRCYDRNSGCGVERAVRIVICVVIVVVLDKRMPAQSQTVLGLDEVFPAQPQLLEGCQVFAWVNTTPPLAAQGQGGTFPFPAVCRRGTQNLGIACTHNQAVVFAEFVQAPWMLQIDRDTTVAPHFLDRMLDYSELFKSAHQIATVAPLIRSHGALVSPRRLCRFNHIAQIQPGVSGIYKNLAYVVNSATLMRLSPLREIGDFHKEMTVQRYPNFLAAESVYGGLYPTPPKRAVHLLRGFARIMRKCRRYHSQSKRVTGWRRHLAQRDIPIVEDEQVIGWEDLPHEGEWS